MTGSTYVNEAFSAGIGFGLGLTMAGFALFKAKPPEKTKQVIICQACKNRNPEENRFCSNCGRRLFPQPQVICPKCGAAVAARKFCGQCGVLIRTRKNKDVDGDRATL